MLVSSSCRSESEDSNANNSSREVFNSELTGNTRLNRRTNTNQTVRSHTGERDEQGLHTQGGGGDWTLRNETQVDTMRAELAITQKETIRTRADNHRETGDTRTSK